VDLNWTVVIAGAVVGFVVGMTGMGGGALMTPMLIFFFRVDPLAAVSSDLVVSLFMKPVGASVHIRRGTVDRRLVGWLCLGSVPAAFAGVLLLRGLGSSGRDIEDLVRVALGVALLLAVATMLVKALLALRRHARAARAARITGVPAAAEPPGRVIVRPVATILIGVIGGLVVGMTSVGSGSLIIVLLLLLYPLLKTAQLVGTDLVQAVPLVASAAVGHMLFGDVRIGLTASLLVGAIPGVWAGAQLSSRAPQMLIRRALVLVLFASGLKLVGLPTGALAPVILTAAVLGPLAWMAARRAVGLPALWRVERSRAGTPAAATAAAMSD
jgi:uncharacterized protein